MKKQATFVKPGERFGDADLIMSSLKRQSAAYAYEPTELLELPRTSYYQCVPSALHSKCFIENMLWLYRFGSCLVPRLLNAAGIAKIA